MSMIDVVVGKEFRISKKLGSGAFGEVYLALNIKNQTEVAVKVQPSDTKSPQLFYEAKLISILTSDDNTVDHGIPHVYHCGAEGSYNAMVMDLLGKSLEDHFNGAGKKFDLRTTLLLGYQMLERLEFVHKKGFLHRDMKPDNFMLGTGRKARRLYLIDFGLSKKFTNKNGVHVPYKDNKNLTGTARYASLNTHLGIEQGRRDDIEGMTHVLLYFVRGELPWMNLKAKGKKQKYQKIMQSKLAKSPQELCQGLPSELMDILVYSRTIQFEAEPDYNFLKGKFQSAMKRENIVNEPNPVYCFS